MHSILPGPAQELTLIPRGVALYSGSDAIAALGAGDQRSVRVTLTFSTSYAFLPKQFAFAFSADTSAATTFSNVGQGQYALDRIPQTVRFGMNSDGAAREPGAGFESMISWAPALNWPRMFVMGNTGDTMAFVFNDPDVPAAGRS